MRNEAARLSYRAAIAPRPVEFTKESFDGIAVEKQREVRFALASPGGFGGNGRLDPTIFRGLDQSVGIIGLVGEKGFRLDLVEQRFGLTKSDCRPGVSDGVGVMRAYGCAQPA